MDQLDIIKQIDIYEHRLAVLKAKLYDHKPEPVKVLDQCITDNWSIYQGDCVEVLRGLPSDSIHYSIFSPPFLSLYVYSANDRDMGNSKTDAEFYSHFRYLLPELWRVLMPGRLVTVHCSVVLMTLTHDGQMGLKDFPGEIVRLFQEHGFIYHSKVNVWKDPLLQATRTKALMLAHKQISKDSVRCGQGFADELLTFYKPGDNPEPVAHGRGFEQYIGEQPEPKHIKKDDPRHNKYSHEVWQRYASPVWWDINQNDTLNVRAARDEKDERHICPLQLQTIARCLELWTNPGDIVLSPFGGIGSEGYEAVKMGRRAILIELKESYYKTMKHNMESVSTFKRRTLF